MPQTWFKYKGSKKVLISRIHAGFAAFAAEPSVALPVGFQNALAEKFDFGNNLKRLGLEGKARQGAKDWKDWKARIGRIGSGKGLQCTASAISSNTKMRFTRM